MIPSAPFEIHANGFFISSLIYGVSDGSAKVLIVEGVAHRMAEDVFGAAKDGGVLVQNRRVEMHGIATEILICF